MTSRRGGKKVKSKSKSKSKKARKNNKRKTKRNKKRLKGGWPSNDKFNPEQITGGGWKLNKN